MAEIVNMPKLGFDMAEGTLIRWVVSEHEAVQKGQVLAEIETDKATVEVESPYTGVVRRHLVDQGSIVPVSSPIAVVGEEGEEIDIEQLVGELQEQESREKPEAVVEEGPAETRVETRVETETISEESRLPEGVRASPLARRMAQKLGLD